MRITLAIPGPDRGILGVTAGPHHLSLKRSGPGQSGYQVHDEEVTAVTIERLNRFWRAEAGRVC